ncbi:LytR C-terminal domain-containing protein [Knoellia sp. p5-6-4]|uniref:LytR C-terminal domain-containing protein n=1 Tax=unclassified Knoellia TaxID=2618719 RepID=UPI0023DC56F6|nr:LytR C-terminal domain-containing protein [Knoellia sp. p5-6-4]MDF2144791.1 LytR C-terminal domain-containing protein [Knoellia sp. p5-6-4]
MSYIVESGASSSRRSRRRRALITLAVVALMLFFAFWYAYSYYRTSSEPTAAPAPTCATTAPAKAGAAPRPAEITVNVYNATDRAGLAAKTAAEVRQRGFDVATITNDPLRRTVTGPAEVRYGKSGTAKAKVVLGLVKGAKPVRDGRVDGSVDLVLGEKFTALVKRPAAPAAEPSAPAC